MDLQIGNSYLIVFNVGGRALTFTCEIISVDGGFITFKDRFEKILSYNINTIISCEEILK